LQASAQEWLSKIVSGLNIFGKETLPQEGPVLIASNHPGTYDGLAIAAAVQRQDLKIVASGNPFFRSLPNVREYFIYATRDTHVRMAAIRTALRHLQAGGALLIFPINRTGQDVQPRVMGRFQSTLLGGERFRKTLNHGDWR
jgi:1-acyl-sn-glycerol-3-phosphate acyltransferase